MYRKINSNKCEKCLFKNLIFGEKTNTFINVMKDKKKGTKLYLDPLSFYLWTYI